MGSGKRRSVAEILKRIEDEKRARDHYHQHAEMVRSRDDYHGIQDCGSDLRDIQCWIDALEWSLGD